MGKAILAVIAIVILVAAGLVVFKFSGGITGTAAASKAETFVSTTDKGTCADSDGNNPKTRGVTIAKTSDGLLSFRDHCASPNILLEGTCDRGQLVKKEVKCSCLDGVCV